MATIRYQLTAPEVVREFRRHRQPSRLRFWARVFLGMLGLALLAGAWRSADPDEAAGFILFGGVALLAAALSAALEPWIVRSAYRREVRRNPGLTEAKEFTFDERGLVATSPYVRVGMQWAAVHQLTQDEHYLRLFTEGAAIPIALPKRAFTAEALAAFLRCYEHAPKNPPPFSLEPLVGTPIPADEETKAASDSL